MEIINLQRVPSLQFHLIHGNQQFAKGPPFTISTDPGPGPPEAAASSKFDHLQSGGLGQVRHWLSARRRREIL